MRRQIILAETVVVMLLSVLVFGQSSPTSLPNPLVIVENGRYGYINHKGEIVIQPVFLWGTDFEDGFGAVYVCGSDVWIDASGKLVPQRPANKRRLYRHRQGEKFGFADSSGDFLIKPIYEDALPFSDGLAAVRVGALWGFIDSNGRQVIPPVFEDAFYFIDGVGTAEDKNGSVLIDKTGRVIASGFELTHGIVADGRVPVCREAKCGFLDLCGNIAIPLIYDDVDSFSRGLAAVRKGEKWGYIDETGHTAIPFMFDQAGPFASGLAPAGIGNETGFIDRTGEFAFHLAFKYAPGFLTGNADGLGVADYDVSPFWTVDGAFGYVNSSGKVIWGPIKESPEHAPILGWSEEDKVKSCEGLPQAIREAVKRLPEN